MSLVVRNPHSVLAALQTRPHEVMKIRASKHALQKGADDPWAEVVKLAQEKRRPIESIGPERGGRNRDDAGRDGGAGEATLKEREPVEIEALFSGAKSQDRGQGIWLALDQVQDPQNLGSIFRTAAFFGVRGILITQDRSAPMSSIVYDVSCGGVEQVPFATIANLKHGFEVAKEAGAWVLGTSEHADQDLSSVSRDRPWLIVLGNEEKGLRRLTLDSCDVLCRIPSQGKLHSLNVATATAVMLTKFSF